MERFHTTVTERSSFRTCRRQWYFEVQERLAHRNRVAWALIFGDCMHSALEAYYRQNKRSLRAAKMAFTKAWVREDEILQDVYEGLYKGSIEEEWWQWRDKGYRILEYYKIYDDQAEFDFDQVLAVNIEARGFVDILNPYTEERLEGLPLLSGRIDLVVERKDGIWIWDHKTTASAYDARALDIDDQGTGYCYIYWRMTGDIPRGFVHNGLIKEPPIPPRMLQSGALSKDKAQRTTYDLYLKAIKDYNLEESDYEDVLSYLQEKGWSQFFVRDAVVMNEEQLLSFEKRLFYEYEDMVQVIEDSARAYPNPSQRICPGCSILPLCQTMEEQGDVEFLKGTMYAEMPVRAEIPKKILSPKWEGV